MSTHLIAALGWLGAVVAGGAASALSLLLYRRARAVAAASEMLDPTWTPERGYSHAARLMEILDAASGA